MSDADRNATTNKKEYIKPEVEHAEKISRVFLACRSSIGGCTETLQQAGTCPP